MHTPLPRNICLSRQTILITGAAGFIGAHLVCALLRADSPLTIVGVDNLNDFYDPALKHARLAEIERVAAAHPEARWMFIKGNIADRAWLDEVFATHKPTLVVHLAAQAGVRYSITHPDAYIESNLLGFYHILEACRHHPVAHLVYASSSSVYGENRKIPYAAEDRTDHPVSLYAATKKSNELMAHTYAKLYNIPATGLRFFTVYGPAGRPDMAYFSFTDKFVRGECIELFHHGHCRRDFTYVDDIVEGMMRIMQHAPEKTGGEDGQAQPPHAIYNIGNASPENLLVFVTILQEELIRAAVLPPDFDWHVHAKFRPMQPGDVPVTYADTTPLERDFGFKPATPLREGLRRFAEWYRDFYRIQHPRCGGREV